MDNKMEKLNNNYGFTFIELLIGLVIALLVAGVLVSFTRLSFDSHLTVSNTMEEIWDSRQTMNLITEELKYAIEAEPAADNRSINFKTLDPANFENIVDNRIFLNNDNYICINNNLGTRYITKFPVNDLICTYNKDDKLNMTIDIMVVFSDHTTLTTSVITLNDPSISEL